MEYYNGAELVSHFGLTRDKLSKSVYMKQHKYKGLDHPLII